MQICTLSPATCVGQQSFVEAKNKLRINHDGNCSCCCCNPSATVCYKYVQPEVPKSFAPLRHYWKSTIPIDGNTTYQFSYWDCQTQPAEPVIPRNCLTTGNCEMSHDTTYKSSYLDYVGVKPVESITPCEKQWLGRGPMQGVTTQKHDYSWKLIETTPAIKAKDNIICPPVPLVDDTTYKLSYYESCPPPVTSYAPVRQYIKPDVPVEDNTTYRLSYWPHDTAKEEQAWTKKQEYLPPVVPIEGCTTYKLSYYPQAQAKSLPIVPMPAENILNAGCCSDKNTTYRLSYFGCQGEKRDSILQSGHVVFSTCPPAYDTVHQMSYLGNWCVKPEEPITPCNKQLLGRGPMQEVTTQKHDYTWKQMPVKEGFRPKDTLVPSNAPVDCCTTNRMSYLSNNYKSLIPRETYAPVCIYEQPETPMEGETVMNLSYQPVETTDQKERSYKDNSCYVRPVVPIDVHTTYNTSYIPPGILAPMYVDNIKPCQASTTACC